MPVASREQRGRHRLRRRLDLDAQRSKGDASTRIDPATNDIAATIPVRAGSFTAVFGYGRVWVSSTEKSVVSVIHPASNKVIAEIPVDKAPRFMSAGEGYVWTLNQGTGTRHQDRSVDDEGGRDDRRRACRAPAATSRRMKARCG